MKALGIQADTSGTCKGCEAVEDEPGAKAGYVWHRCMAPGRCRGYAVGREGRYIPYIPAWCPKRRGETL